MGVGGGRQVERPRCVACMGEKAGWGEGVGMHAGNLRLKGLALQGGETVTESC